MSVSGMTWILIIVGILGLFQIFMFIYPSNYVSEYSNVHSALSSSKTNDNDEVVTNDWMAEMEKKYFEDNERIKKACKNFNHKPKNMKTKSLNILWTDTRHSIVGCLNAKVGSSTWKSHFYNLLPEETRKRLEEKFGPPYYRFSIVKE